MKHRYLLLYILVFLFLTIISGTITSGFHLVDDHEIIRMKRDMMSMNFFEMMDHWISRDFKARFRPLYFVQRISQVSLFSTNFLYWNLYRLLTVSLTAYFLFLTMRKLKVGTLASFLFPLLTIFGKASPIIWRLGPQEPFGFCLLSLCLLLSVERTKLKDIGFLFSLTGMCLFKESFILAVPFLLAFRFLILEGNCIKTYLKKDLKVFTASSFVMLSCLFVILNFVGTDDIEYAGVAGTNIFKVIKTSWLYYKLSYGKFTLVALVFLYLGSRFYLKDEKKRELKALSLKILVLFLILSIPQFVVYTKSGIFERYLIPAILMASTPLVLAFDFLQKNVPIWLKKIQISKKWVMITGGVFLFLATLSLIPNTLTTVVDWYSNLKDESIKPHWRSKFLLGYLLLLVVFSIPMLLKIKWVNSELFNFLDKNKLRGKMTMIYFVFLLTILFDRFFMSYRYAEHFSKQSIINETIFDEVKKLSKGERITFIIDPIAQEHLVSFEVYFKEILNFQEMYLHPSFVESKKIYFSYFEYLERLLEYDHKKLLPFKFPEEMDFSTMLRKSTLKMFQNKRTDRMDDVIQSKLIAIEESTAWRVDHKNLKGYEKLTSEFYHLYRKLD